MYLARVVHIIASVTGTDNARCRAAAGAKCLATASVPWVEWIPSSVLYSVVVCIGSAGRGAKNGKACKV